MDFEMPTVIRTMAAPIVYDLTWVEEDAAEPSLAHRAMHGDMLDIATDIIPALIGIHPVYTKSTKTRGHGYQWFAPLITDAIDHFRR